MIRRTTCKLFLVCLLCTGLSSSSRAEVVFQAVQQDLTLNTYAGTVGDEVVLGGWNRFVTSFTIGINAVSSDPNQTDDFRLRFFLPNGDDGGPGTMIWESPVLQEVPILEGSPEEITFSVPAIRVPDTFIWLVEHAYTGSGMASFP